MGCGTAPENFQGLGIFVLRDSRDKAELASLLGVKPDDILPHMVVGGEGIVDEKTGDINGVRKGGPIKGASYLFRVSSSGQEQGLWYWMPIGFLDDEDKHGFFLPDIGEGNRGELIFTGEEIETWKRMQLAGAAGIHAEIPPVKKLDEDGKPRVIEVNGKDEFVYHDPSQGKHSFPYPRKQPIIMINNQDFAQVNMRLDESSKLSSFMPHNESGELGSLSNLLVLIPSNPQYNNFSVAAEKKNSLKHVAFQMGKTEDGLSGMMKFAKNKYMSLSHNFQKLNGSQIRTLGILSRAEGCNEKSHKSGDILSSHLSSLAPFIVEEGPTSSYPDFDAALDFEKENYKGASGDTLYKGHIRLQPRKGTMPPLWKICCEGPIIPPKPPERPPTEITPPPSEENPPVTTGRPPGNPGTPPLRRIPRPPGKVIPHGNRRDPGGRPPARKEPTIPISGTIPTADLGGSGGVTTPGINQPSSNNPGQRPVGGTSSSGGSTAPARSPHETSYPSIEGHTIPGSENGTESDSTSEYGGDFGPIEPYFPQGDSSDNTNSLVSMQYNVSANQVKIRNLWKNIFNLDITTVKKYPKYIRHSKPGKRNKYGIAKKLKKRKKEITNIWSMLSYLLPNSDNQYNTERLKDWAGTFPKSGEDSGVYFTPGDSTKGNPQGYSDYEITLMLNHLRSKLSFGEPGNSQVDIKWENGKLYIQGSPLKIDTANYLPVPGDPGDVYIDPVDNALKVTP